MLSRAKRTRPGGADRALTTVMTTVDILPSPSLRKFIQSGLSVTYLPGVTRPPLWAHPTFLHAGVNLLSMEP